MKARADYTYTVMTNNIIAIEDLNLGDMSVTNDIENVIEDIMTKEGMSSDDLNEYIIVYKDTTGRWNGWSHEKQRFVAGTNDGNYFGAVDRAKEYKKT